LIKGVFMGIRLHRTRTVAAATAVISAAALAFVAAAPADAATAVKTVRVRMSDSSIIFTGGGATTAGGVTTLHAGRYHFHVVGRGGHHSLQLLRFQNGYTAEQLQKDFAGDPSQDVTIVQRIDNGVVFLGGVDAAPKHPGDLVVKLRATQLIAADFGGDAIAKVNVVGTAPEQTNVPHDGTYTAFSYGWDVSKHLPTSGMVKFANQADQPHFLVLQRVKDSTTNAKVRKFINSGGQGNPPWVLKASTESGVLSPGKSQLFSYDLPAGKYLVACFWPDYFTGMPHAFMGMWKLVTLS
jgi:uncharacterized cupredoxin-like copper-binding protein